MSIRPDEYQTLIETLWTALLGLEFEPATDFAPDGDEDQVCAQVQIRGEETWTVRVTCPEPLGQRIAAAMFHDHNDGSVRDVHDALGELANIVAGNTKTALLASPADITLPHAVTVAATSRRTGLHAHLACGGHLVQFSTTQEQASTNFDPHAEANS